MSSDSRPIDWLARKKWYFVTGVLFLSLLLAPFPLGCGMIYPIADKLRGHPQGRHGSQPQQFVGLWIREEVIEYDFLGQAFYLMPDGMFAGMPGMTLRRWHFDDERLCIDAVSRCGNCYQGNVTTELSVRFVGSDQMILEDTNKYIKRGIVGKYRKLNVTDELKAELKRQMRSTNETDFFKARSILRAIEHFEGLSKVKR